MTPSVNASLFPDLKSEVTAVLAPHRQGDLLADLEPQPRFGRAGHRRLLLLGVLSRLLFGADRLITAPAILDEPGTQAADITTFAVAHM